MASKIVISKDFRFEASHILPKHPGKCSRLHGHSWKLRVEVIGRVDRKTGFVCDFGDLKQCVESNVISKLDHTHLGWGVAICPPEYEMLPEVGYNAMNYRAGRLEVPYFRDLYPTSENLCIAIARVLQPLIPELKAYKGEPTIHHTTMEGAPKLYAVTIKETCTSAARWVNPDPTVTDVRDLA